MAKARKKRKKTAFRKGDQNRFSKILVVMVVLFITVAIAVRSVEMQQRLNEYTAQEQKLQEQIEMEERRAEQIEAFRKYTQTKSYKEEIAREKLGLMYEGEILFKEKD